MTVLDRPPPDLGRAGGPILLATKLRPPAIHERAIARRGLVERLQRGSGCRLSLIACPPGFGKTTLLASWREIDAEHRPVAWMTLDPADNDPVRLWAHTIEALRRVCPALGRTFKPETVGADSIVEVVLPRLVNELDGQDGVTLIFDDFHCVARGPASTSVAWFVEHAPSSVHVVVSTRTEPPLPVAVLRAHGDLLELRADDLRFTLEEAHAFLNGSLRLGLAPEDIEELVKRTEGWPAGLYLAALSLEGAVDRHDLVSRFGASSRHVVDFLVDEVLAGHDSKTQQFMFRSSVLGRLSGPLCDAVTQMQDSARTLEAIRRTNLFLSALDGQNEWYRFHPVFAQLLRLELEEREPGLAQMLHRRAYEWHRDHGLVGDAIHHAVEAGMFGEAAELIEESWLQHVNAFRFATVLAWLQQFPEEVLRSNARLFMVKAWVLSMSGKRPDAAPAMAAIEGLGKADGGALPHGFSSAESSLMLLRAAFPEGDVGAQMRDGLRASELEGPESPWRPVAGWALGVGLYFSDRFDEAEAWFRESVALAPASRQWLVAAASLAYRSLIEAQRQRVDEQVFLAEEAARVCADHGLEGVMGAQLLALGLSIAVRGRLEDALPVVERSVIAFRAWGQPLTTALGLLYQASLLRTAGQSEAAGIAIAEARSVIDRCPDPGILLQRLEAIAGSPRAARVGTPGENLTRSELRVLGLLDTALTERDIAGKLYLSPNTVHSHVRSIYRKLGVSSRRDALGEARRRRWLG